MKRAVFIVKGMKEKVQYRMRIEADDIAELGGQLFDHLILGSSSLHHMLSAMWKEETIAVWRKTLENGSWTHICIGLVPDSVEELEEALLKHIRNNTPVEYYHDESFGLHMHVAVSEAGMEEAIVFPLTQLLKHDDDPENQYQGELIRVLQQSYEADCLGFQVCQRMLPGLIWEKMHTSEGAYGWHYRGVDYEEKWAVEIFLGVGVQDLGWNYLLKEGRAEVLRGNRAANPDQAIGDMVGILLIMKERGAQFPDFLTGGPDPSREE